MIVGVKLNCTTHSTVTDSSQTGTGSPRAIIFDPKLLGPFRHVLDDSLLKVSGEFETSSLIITGTGF